MSEYMFGVENGQLPAPEVKRRERIAREHGADFIHVRLRPDGWRSWFECPNRGEPFNGDVQRAVLRELTA